MKTSLSPPPAICPDCVKNKAALSNDGSVAVIFCEHNATGAVYRFDQQNWIAWSPMTMQQFNAMARDIGQVCRESLTEIHKQGLQ